MTQPGDPRTTLPFSILTLGVDDVDVSAAFYVAVGFDRPPGPTGLVLLRTLGTVIALHPWDELADDTTLAHPRPPQGATPSFRGVIMSSNRPSRADVDTAFARWVGAGGTGVKPPQEVFWGGYSSYVADPDGHLWEPAHNPLLTFPTEGGFVVHE